MKKCVFCGQPGDTKEHIIPRWLQKHFDLKDQKLQLINQTTMHYCRVVIPACKKCNSETFSRLESKVHQNTATEQDYYLWALKIRYCLSIMDNVLPEDRARPYQGPMLIDQYANIGHDFIKHAFTHLSTQRFYFRPYPFGSVFLFDNPIKDSEFGLVDATHPHWALTIALPNHKILSVLFTDRGLVKKSLENRFKLIGGLTTFLKNIEETRHTRLFSQYLTFKLLVSQYQISNIPYGVSFKDNGIYSQRLPRKLKYRNNVQLSMLNQIADACNLPTELANDVYQSLTSPLNTNNT